MINKYKIKHSCGHELPHAIIADSIKSDDISKSKNFLDKSLKKCADCFAKETHVFKLKDECGLEIEYQLNGEKEAQEAKANQLFNREVELYKLKIKEQERLKEEENKNINGIKQKDENS